MALLSLVNSVAADILVLGGDLLKYTHNVSEQRAFVNSFLLKYIRSFDIPILLTPGNTDWPVEILRIGTIEHVTVLGGGANHCLGTDICFQGYPYVNSTPFRNKTYERRDLAHHSFDMPSDRHCYVTDVDGIKLTVREDYFNRLPSMEEDLRNGLIASSIWVMHNPPYNTKLDVTKHVGNIGGKAIRRAIEHVQPKLTLHGHVHESPILSGSWLDRIGTTISINPGTGRALHAVTISFDGAEQIESIEHSVYGEWG